MEASACSFQTRFILTVFVPNARLAALPSETSFPVQQLGVKCLAEEAGELSSYLLSPSTFCFALTKKEPPSTGFVICTSRDICVKAEPVLFFSLEVKVFAHRDIQLELEVSLSPANHQITAFRYSKHFIIHETS